MPMVRVELTAVPSGAWHRWVVVLSEHMVVVGLNAPTIGNFIYDWHKRVLCRGGMCDGR